jgi:hypothetical protein
VAISKVADRASAASNSSVTTVDLSLSGLTVGNVLIIRTAAENSGGGGAARTITPSDQSGTILNGAGWTAIQRNNDPGAASAGITCNLILINIQATSGTIRLTYSGSVVQACVAEEWSGISITTVGTDTTNVGTASTNLASLTDSSVASGNLLYAVEAVEGPQGDTYTNDADTTNGSWTALSKAGTTNATADQNSTTYGGYKITTGAGSQTYNPTINNARDSAGIMVEIAPVPVNVAGTITTAWSGWTATAAAQPIQRNGSIATTWRALTMEPLRPSSVPSATGSGLSANGASVGDSWQLLNQQYPFADDDMYLQHDGSANATITYGLTDIASLTAIDDVAMVMRFEVAGYTAGTSRIRAQLVRSDSTEVTEPLVVWANSDTTGFYDMHTGSFAFTAAGLADLATGPSAVNDWQVRLSFDINSGTQIRISAMELDVAQAAQTWSATATGVAFLPTVNGAISTIWTVAAETIRPDGTPDASVGGTVLPSSGVIGDAHTLVDDDPDPDLVDDGDFVFSPGAGAAFIVFSLSNVSALAWATSVRVRVRSGRGSYTSGTSRLSATLERADGTDVSSNVTINQNVNGTFDDDVELPLNDAGLADAASPTGINGWRLRIDFSNNIAETAVMAVAVDVTQSGWLATAAGTASAATPEHFGTITTAWSGWTATAAATVDHPATVTAAWSGWTATAAGVVEHTATVATSWAGWTATATATRETFAVITTAWAEWTATALGAPDHPATIATAWDGWTATATAQPLEHPATITTAWSGWTATATAIRETFAAVATAWSGWTATAAATRETFATASAAFDGWTATGTATRDTAATVTTAWDGWTATATGTATTPSGEVFGAIDTAWAGWTATGVGTVDHHASISTVWASGETVAGDDFNRADAAAPGLGSGWDAPGWRLESNRAQKDGGNDNALFLTDIGSLIHAVEFDVVGTVGVQNPAYTVIHAGSQVTPAQNAVLGYIEPGGSKQATIAQYQGGSFTIIGGGTSGLDISGTYTLRLEVDTAEARLYHNDVLVHTDDISALTNLGTYGGMAAQNASPPIDDFTITAGTAGWVATAIATVERGAAVATAWAGWTATATANRDTAAAVSTPWAGWTATADGTRATAGIIATAWDGWTATADGSVSTPGGEQFGTIATTFAGWSATAAANVEHAAAITTAWSGWTATAAGIVERSAIAAAVWSGWTATAAATVDHPATVSTTWAGWTATAVATRDTAGTITTTWGAWTATATGVRTGPGAAIASWAGWTATADGHVSFFGTVTTAWAGWTATALGGTAGAANGAIDTTWSTWTATAAATPDHPATVTTTWDGWTASGVAGRTVNATVSTTWGGAELAADGVVGRLGTVSTTWPSWDATAAGAIDRVGVVTTAWSGWTATAAGIAFGTLVIVGDLVAWRVDPYRTAENDTATFTAWRVDPIRQAENDTATFTAWRVDPIRTADNVGSAS